MLRIIFLVFSFLALTAFFPQGGGANNQNLFIDPIICCNAAGSNVTTTGAISSNSASLIVADASGWSAGMGIAVTGAGVAGAPLVTSVMSCGPSSGPCTSATFILAANASTDVAATIVNHDDTVAIQTAINAAEAASNGSGPGVVKLRAGNYNLSSELDISSGPMMLVGDGVEATVLHLQMKDTISNGINISFAGVDEVHGGVHLANFYIDTAPTTSTNGSCIFLQGSPGHTVNNVLVENLVLDNCAYWGITVGNFQARNSFDHINIVGFFPGGAIQYNSPAPYGDVSWDNILVGTGIYITNSDTQEFTNLKVLGGWITVTGAGTVAGLRFTNPSLELCLSAHGACLNLGNSSDVLVNGGEYLLGGSPNNGAFVDFGSSSNTCIAHVINRTAGSFLNYHNGTPGSGC